MCFLGLRAGDSPSARVGFRLRSLSIAEYDFEIKIAGRSSLTICSAPLNNEWAKKSEVAKETILRYVFWTLATLMELTSLAAT